ncbi:MAG: hypothetical protein ACYCSS_14205, partial [Sulfuriferula sp.]
LLHVFDPQKANDMENFPCPRTWVYVGKAMQMRLPSDLEFAAFAGAVGEGAAIELKGFLTMLRSNLPSIDGILLDPDSASIPTKPDLLWAVTTALAKKVTTNNCGRVFRYAERLYESGLSEFAVLMLKDVLRLCSAVTSMPEWTSLCVSPLGKTFIQ